MSDRNTEDIIGALYDMVQDARSMPLAPEPLRKSRARTYAVFIKCPLNSARQRRRSISRQ